MAIERVPSSPIVPPATPGAAGAPALVAGQILEARVLALLAGNLVRLAVGGSVIEAQAAAKLAPGAQVRLKVVEDGGVQRLVLIDRPAGGRTEPAGPVPEARAARGPPAPAPTPPGAPEAVVARATRAALARQTSLAPLFADLVAVVSRSQPRTLPIEVLHAADEVLRFRLEADRPVTPRAVEGALARSGLFREALLARLGPAPRPAAGPPLDPALAEALRPALVPSPAAQVPAADMKSALLALATALRAALGAREPVAPPAGDSVPRPPRRGEVPAAQPAARPQVPVDAEPRAVMRALLAEADGALARVLLSQLASLDPAPTSPPQQGAGRLDAPAPTFLFEVPLVADGRTSIAQIEIGREEREPGTEPDARGWRVRFCVDVEPAGPVHATLTLRGERLAVALWAERAETVARLRAGAAGFEDELVAADLALERLQVRGGRPEAASPSPRHFLDRPA